MPVPASELEVEPFLRMLLMGPMKLGKSTHVVSTSPNPVRVLLCESDSALHGAKRITTDFEFERIRADDRGHIYDTMLSFVLAAKRDAKAGKIKTLVLDPLSVFARRLLLEMEQQFTTGNGNVDGRKAHPEFSKRMFHIIDLLLTIPCHVIVVTHYMDVGGDDNGDKPKTGPGIVPLMPNMATRTELAGLFYDVVWFDIVPKFTAPTKPGAAPPKPIEHYNDRIFVTGPEGAWGVGCRSLKKNVVLPAHIGRFIERMEAMTATEEAPPPAPKNLKPMAKLA